MPKLLDRYIFQQLIGPFFLGFCMFIIVIAIDPLITALQNIVNDNKSVYLVFRWFCARLPQDMIFTFPMSMLLTTLLVFGRMSKDSETVAMKAGGINFFRVLLPVMFFAVIVTAVSFLFNELVVPYSNRRANELRREIVGVTEPEAIENSLLRATDGAFVYARKVFQTKNSMEKVLLEYYDQGKLLRRLTSATARWSEIWTLEGVVDQLYEDGKVSSTSTMLELPVPEIKETPSDFAKQGKKPNEMSYAELKRRIEMYERTKFDDPTDLKVELALKTSLPFATVFFALIGSSFGLTTYRSGTFIGFGISVVIIFIYYVIMSFSVAMGKSGILPVFLSAWLQNIIFCFVGILLVRRVNS